MLKKIVNLADQPKAGSRVKQRLPAATLTFGDQ
jgi:hypothetical protein